MHSYDELTILAILAILAIYFDFNNLYGWSLLQEPPYDGHKYVEDIATFTPKFIINYDENGDINYTLVFDVDFSEYLQPLHTDLPLYLQPLHRDLLSSPVKSN